MSGYVWTHFGVLAKVSADDRMVAITNEAGSTRKMSILKYKESAVAICRRCFLLIGHPIDIQTSQNTAEWCTEEWFSDICPSLFREKIENAEGCYGQLFYKKCRTKVFKVFKNREQDGITRDFIESVFRSEIAAYTSAIGNNDIEGLLPKFYGSVDLTGALPEEEQYYPDFAFEIDYIHGHFAGIEDRCISSESSKAVIDKFKDAGIDVSDSNVTYSQNGDIIKVVDIKILA
ncbi:hypothetical protein [Aeromonas sp. MR16]|uniref:hypothetical protein n=1 Tax=Aeromonas sp. MR16 TaxID=2923420 RepID=UPI001F4B43B3|nr:hypothetical protein [Aeromonas sp. MR16]MCH7369871.1 hypothetical protein [Aeromonas sp. MR16]